eukprot:702266-Hanusia_phi.AAC.2
MRSDVVRSERRGESGGGRGRGRIRTMKVEGRKEGLGSKKCSSHPGFSSFSTRTSYLPLRARRVESCSLSMSLEIDEMEPEWLPMIDPKAGDLEPSPNSTVLPLFPLGSFVYTVGNQSRCDGGALTDLQPHSEHRLNIFEPRYRALYNDILFSGSRRFAVCSMDPVDGRFAAVASVFYLKDLKEVSAATNDAVKYICDHEVIGRIRIKKILNPKVWEDRSTYLKVDRTSERTSVYVVLRCCRLRPSTSRTRRSRRTAPGLAPVQDIHVLIVCWKRAGADACANV